MSKIESRLVVKPKIIQSLSLIKNHPINLPNSTNHFRDARDFRVPYDLLDHPLLSPPTQLTFSFLNLY